MRLISLRKKMIPSGVTWTGPSIDDVEVLAGVPKELTALLLKENGVIVRHGALHIRGAVAAPRWHSLREAWFGEAAFSKLYDTVRPTDIPFAEDMLGDQFLLRDGRVLRLIAETGEIEEKESSLAAFLERVDSHPEDYLNLSLTREIEPGFLLFAVPPFCIQMDTGGYSLKACPAHEVILIHADIARQIRSVPEGGHVILRTKE